MDAIHVDLGPVIDEDSAIDANEEDVQEDEANQDDVPDAVTEQDAGSTPGGSEPESEATSDGSDDDGSAFTVAEVAASVSRPRREYRQLYDTVDVFTGGVIATRSYSYDSSRSSMDIDPTPAPVPATATAPQPIATRTESVSSSSSTSSSSSLPDSAEEERSGAVMAKHLDTFSGGFSNDNYQSASTYVGRSRRSNESGLFHRVTDYVSSLRAPGYPASDEAVAVTDNSAHGFSASSASQAVTAVQPPQGAAGTDARANSATPDKDKAMSSNSSVASVQSIPEEEFIVYGTNIDDPHLSSHPSLSLPSNCKAVGVVGRDFDEPQAVVKQLAHEMDTSQPPWSEIYFQPMVIPSKDLNRTDCRQYLLQANFHMLILCYNSTETRLMLTSPVGGYYKHVLPYAQKLYGGNKVAIVLSRYQTPDQDLVHTALAERLKAQPLMTELFDHQLVMSWNEHASSLQQQRFLSIASTPKEEVSQDCVIL